MLMAKTGSKAQRWREKEREIHIRSQSTRGILFRWIIPRSLQEISRSIAIHSLIRPTETKQAATTTTTTTTTAAAAATTATTKRKTEKKEKKINRHFRHQICIDWTDLHHICITFASHLHLICIKLASLGGKFASIGIRGGGEGVSVAVSEVKLQFVGGSRRFGAAHCGRYS